MIEKLKQELLKYDFIAFALLFGSYAKESQNERLSDIDIAIYTNTEIDLLEYGFIVSELETAFSKKIDLVILNDLYKTDTKLAFNILDKYKTIFINDENIFVDFKINTLKYYLDKKYMYEIFDRAILERLDNGTFGKTKAS